MPWITTLLLTVILLLQYTLWLGRGSLPHLEQIEQSLKTQKQKNAELKLRNTAMEAEIQDLKRGYGAIEERARSELGMVKPKEILYQYLTPPDKQSVIIVQPKPKPSRVQPKTPVKQPATAEPASEDSFKPTTFFEKSETSTLSEQPME